MSTISFNGVEVHLNGHSLKMPYAVLDAFLSEGKLIVLLDPDAYMLDPAYKAHRRQTGIALRNLVAFDLNGRKLWEAEYPQNSDYYYKISSKTPLVVYSFSSFACEIDPLTGNIKAKSFFK
jgi:hypothetical protein